MLECVATCRAGCRGSTLAWLCAIHVLIATWVAWYCVDAVWASAPLGVSPTPLPPLVFTAVAITGGMFVMAIGPGIGAAMLRGPWMGGNPTLALPFGSVARAIRAWADSVCALSLIAVARLPLDLALFAMGGIAFPQFGWALLWQAGVMLVGPLIGIAVALWRGHRRSSVGLAYV